jgi:hypothetical protein
VLSSRANPYASTNDYVGIMIMKFLPIAGIALAIAASAFGAQNLPPANDALQQAYANGKRVSSITPVFSQLIRFAIPEGFATVFERTNGRSYTLEMVRQGETTAAWTQMITLTGAQGLTANANITPQGLAGLIAGGFKKHCPDTFAAAALGSLQTSGLQQQEGFAAVASCGSVNHDHSETALLVAIKGAADYYTLQWAERGPARSQPIAIVDSEWITRLERLKPIIICSKKPGEKAPYPTCLNQSVNDKSVNNDWRPIGGVFPMK